MRNIHRPVPLATTLPALYDFSASGAAIGKGISVGRDCQNHALLDIGADGLECHWHMFCQDTAPGPVRIKHADWSRV